MKRKQTFLFFLLLFIVGLCSGQRKGTYYSSDKFSFFIGTSMGVLPMKITGTDDLGDEEYSTTTLRRTDTPVFKRVDTLGLALNFIFHCGLNIPFYRNENFSVGTKLGIGIGRQYSIRATQGFSSYLLFEYPQYLYYRNYKSDVDFSIMAGYKYSNGTLPYHLFLLAFDFYLNRKVNFHFYGSPFSYNYYSLFTNGELKPEICIREFGISCNYNF
jgi:hypothetical protein